MKPKKLKALNETDVEVLRQISNTVSFIWSKATQNTDCLIDDDIKDLLWLANQSLNMLMFGIYRKEKED